MKAVGYRRALALSEADALVDFEAPMPEPLGCDLLVEVRAVSVNPVDTKLRRNAAPADGATRILGFDAAGVVRGLGPDAEEFAIGDEVFYAGVTNRPGSNAEFQLVDARIAGHKPRTLSFAEAAALPLTSLTAWEMLFDRFRLPRDQSVPGTLLIVGGAGGVGSMAIQLAAELTDLTVIATASRPETVAWCRQLGAHHVIDHRGDMAAQLAALELGAPETIFITTQALAHWPAMVALLAPEGAIGIIEAGAPLDVGALRDKCGTLHTEMMFARALLQTPSIAAQHRTLEAVAHLVDNGTLKTTMTQHFGAINAANLKRAHAVVEAGTSIGKIVLERA